MTHNNPTEKQQFISLRAEGYSLENLSKLLDKIENPIVIEECDDRIVKIFKIKRGQIWKIVNFKIPSSLKKKGTLRDVFLWVTRNREAFLQSDFVFGFLFLNKKYSVNLCQ